MNRIAHLTLALSTVGLLAPELPALAEVTTYARPILTRCAKKMVLPSPTG